MCKIIALTNLSKVKQLKTLTEMACVLVSTTERDGFGYAVQGTKGVFGERTIEPSSFKVSWSSPLMTAPYAKQVYNRFGTKSKANGAGIFHGRTSTNKGGLINTHPIVKNDWTLIHNGVVSNHGPDYIMETSNDTEHLVHYLSTIGIKGIEEHLTGYYAVAALDPNGRLHVVRDSTASLYVAEIEQIDSQIFATRADHISELCEAMNWTHSVPALMTENTYLVFQGSRLIEHSLITPRGRTRTESKHASKSLGYELTAETDWPAFREYDQRAEASSWTSGSSTEYSEDEACFLTEVKTYADASYTFVDYKGKELDFADFQALDDDDKLSCTVIRGDGTVCDQVNYYSERLYQGA